jgi:hypothetical protein
VGGGLREICVYKIRWADVVRLRPHKRPLWGVFCPRASETDMFWSVLGLASGVARENRQPDHDCSAIRCLQDLIGSNTRRQTQAGSR